jgi:hypothetical protein
VGKISWRLSELEDHYRMPISRSQIPFVFPGRMLDVQVKCESYATFVSLIDSFKASRMVSTPCSSTKSSRLRGSSSSGLKAASTIVDLNMSIVDSSLAFAASKVRITLCVHNQPDVLLAGAATTHLEVSLAFFIDILDPTSNLSQYLNLL